MAGPRHTFEYRILTAQCLFSCGDYLKGKRSYPKLPLILYSIQEVSIRVPRDRRSRRYFPTDVCLVGNSDSRVGCCCGSRIGQSQATLSHLEQGTMASLLDVAVLFWSFFPEK